MKSFFDFGKWSNGKYANTTFLPFLLTPLQRARLWLLCVEHIFSLPKCRSAFWFSVACDGTGFCTSRLPGNFLPSLNCTSPHNTAHHCTSQYCTSLHLTADKYTIVHCILLYYMQKNFTLALHYCIVNQAVWLSCFCLCCCV